MIIPPHLDGGSKASASEIVSSLKSLTTPNKLPSTAIENAVLSVNGHVGDVTMTASSLNAQPLNASLTSLSTMDMSTPGMLYGSAGNFSIAPVSAFIQSVMTSPNDAYFRSHIGLGSSSVLDVNVPYGIPQLDGNGKLPATLMQNTFAAVASTGSYADLVNKPALFDGNYNSLTNRPTIPTVNYPVTSVNTKTGSVVLGASDIGAAATIHNHTIDQVDGLQSALNGKIDHNSTIPYSQISGVPTIPSDTNQLTNGAGFITSASIPSVPVQSVNTKTGNVVLTPADIGAASAIHVHAIGDVTGLQASLDSKVTSGSAIPYSVLTGAPTIPAAQVQTDWNATTGMGVLLNKPSVPTNTNQLTNGSGFITTAQSVAAAPVQSVNSKVGTVLLTNTDVGAAATIHTHAIADVSGLQSSLDSKIATGSSIPYSTLTGAPSVPANNNFTMKGLSDTDDTAIANGYLKWNAAGTSVEYSTSIPYSAVTGAPSIPTNNNQLANGSGFVTSAQAATAAPVQSVNGKTGAVVLSASGVGAASAIHTHVVSDVTGLQAALDGKISVGATIPYTTISGTPTIPVQSVNTKTGAVVLTSTDVGAAPAAEGTKYYRSTGVQATGIKVKYYTVTSDATGAWTLSLGTDFTELLDVQVQTVSNTGVGGIRQATINTYTSTATTITGQTYGNTTIATVLISATNSLTLLANTVVRIRVEGIGA